MTNSRHRVLGTAIVLLQLNVPLLAAIYAVIHSCPHRNHLFGTDTDPKKERSAVLSIFYCSYTVASTRTETIRRPMRVSTRLRYPTELPVTWNL